LNTSQQVLNEAPAPLWGVPFGPPAPAGYEAPPADVEQAILNQMY